ncbi:MAG: DDE-type integrase/transposase/recombinase [Candidatus Bilamarchaeaceae archaeon]
MTDGLRTYEKAFKKAFYSRYKEDKVELIRRVGIRTRETNNVVERLHGALKDRLKSMRGLKSEKPLKHFLMAGLFSITS